MSIRLGRPTVYQQDSAFDCYAPRHRYRMQDNGKMYKYVWKRDLGNVLQGTIIGCTMGKYKYLIDECMRRQFKMNDKQLGLIYYLVCLNRVVSIDDFRELPYMYGRDLSKKTVKWFVADDHVRWRGWIETPQEDLRADGQVPEHLPEIHALLHVNREDAHFLQRHGGGLDEVDTDEPEARDEDLRELGGVREEV